VEIYSTSINQTVHLHSTSNKFSEAPHMSIILIKPSLNTTVKR